MVEVQFAARFGNGCHFWTSGAQLPIHQTDFGFTDKSAHQVFNQSSNCSSPMLCKNENT